jgi:hypothetical protein
MARTAQIRHWLYRTLWSVNPENVKNFNCCCKKYQPSSVMMKLGLMRTATGKEDPELPLLQRKSSLELPASEIAAQINASQGSSNRHISTSTVQRRRCESGLHCRISAKKPLLKDTDKRDLLGPRNTSNGH